MSDLETQGHEIHNRVLRTEECDTLLARLRDSDVFRSRAGAREIARRSSPLDCLVSRGGVLVMRPLLIHSSSRIVEASSRRVLHIEYAESLEVAPGIQLAAA